jgi:nitrogen fixation NifU-like protein
MRKKKSVMADSEHQISQQELLEQLLSSTPPKVLAHVLRPHNPFPLQRYDGHAQAGRDCGDTLEFWIRVENETIMQVNCRVNGCVNMVAAGSATAKLAEGLQISRIKSLTEEHVFGELEGMPKNERHCTQTAVEAIKAAVNDYLRHRNEEPWKKLYR